MFVAINKTSYDEPDVTGLFETREQAMLFVLGCMIDGGIADDEEQAREVYATTDHQWVVPLSEPSPTCLTREAS